MLSPSQIVAALAVLPALLAFPTNISSTLESRDAYNGLPSTLTITTYGDEGCGKAHMIWPNVTYGANKSAQILGYQISRPLVEGEQLDLSNSDCSKYVGKEYRLDRPLPYGVTTCISVPAQWGVGCFRFWHH